MVARQDIVMNRDFAKIRSKFRNLERKPAKRVLTKSIRAGGGPLLRSSRKGMPIQTKTLKRSLRQRLRFYSASGTSLSAIGTTKGKDSKTGRTPSNYLHLVENDTKAHEIRVSGKWAKRQGRGMPKKLAIPIDPDQIERSTDQMPAELHFRNRVRHPGTKGKGALKNAAKTAKGESARKFTAKFRTETLAEMRKA